MWFNQWYITLSGCLLKWCRVTFECTYFQKLGCVQQQQQFREDEEEMSQWQLRKKTLRQATVQKNVTAGQSNLKYRDAGKYFPIPHTDDLYELQSDSLAELVCKVLNKMYYRIVSRICASSLREPVQSARLKWQELIGGSLSPVHQCVCVGYRRVARIYYMN
jgi:hypothetical protein